MSEGFLAVDLGNTRLKATWLPDVGEPETAYFDRDDVEGLMSMVERYGVRRIGMSSVGNVNARLAETLRQAVDGNFLLMTPATELPVRISYEDSRTLGLDRKATAVAAAGICRGEAVTVVDAGTAVTVDLVSADGEFLGGNISPGLSMRFEALHRFTARLPQIDVRDAAFRDAQIPAFGHSTREAMLAGAAGGMLDEICAAALRGVEAGARRMPLTGGDAPWLLGRLRSRLDGKLTIDYEPDLLAKGIRAIYRHHEDTN